MSLEKHRFKAESTDEGIRLDQFVSTRLEGVSKAQTRKLIVAGAVYLNRKRVRIASKPLRPSAVVEVMLDRERLGNTPEKLPGFSNDQIRYEDDDIIVVSKPAGIPTQPTVDNARDNLFDQVKKHTRRQDLALHHRLDRDTRGLVLFVKNPHINGKITQMFQERLIDKEYEAIVETADYLSKNSQLPEKFSIKDFLTRDRSQKKRTFIHSVRSGGKPSHTDFELISSNDDRATYRALPRTGRTHQIRVHLSEFGLPIVGDEIYGKRGGKLGLRAVRLSLEHPVKEQRLTVFDDPSKPCELAKSPNPSNS